MRRGMPRLSPTPPLLTPLVVQAAVAVVARCRGGCGWPAHDNVTGETGEQGEGQACGEVDVPVALSALAAAVGQGIWVEGLVVVGGVVRAVGLVVRVVVVIGVTVGGPPGEEWRAVAATDEAAREADTVVTAVAMVAIVVGDRIEDNGVVVRRCCGPDGSALGGVSSEIEGIVGVVGICHD